MRFVDLFAGIGGFHLGFNKANRKLERKERTRGTQPLQSGRNSSNSERNARKGNESGFECVWANECNKYAAQVYKKNFPETKLDTRDIRTINADEIPSHDLLCAGFPCQSFSIAGKRKGFDDTRGTLFFEIARILETKRPCLVLLENVKGLLSHDDGKTFRRILGVLCELGYWVEWQVLNSKDFGVPQNRERVFIAGHLGRKSGQPIFPIWQNGKSVEERPKERVQQVAQTIKRRDYSSWRGNFI